MTITEGFLMIVLTMFILPVNTYSPAGQERSPVRQDLVRVYDVYLMACCSAEYYRS